MAHDDQSADSMDLKRNFLLLALDVTFFTTAISFADVSIMSVFVIEATGSVFLAGLLQMLRTAVFFIPQVLSMTISGRNNRINILKWTVPSRSCLIIASLVTFLTNDMQLVTVFFFVSLILFGLCDGFTVVPWLELITKCLPPGKRGTFFGVSGFIGGLSQIIAGFFISSILGDPHLVFPRNYGILILVELVVMLCGLPAIFFVKEKEDDNGDEEERDNKDLMTIMRQIPSIVRSDSAIRTLVLTQLLVSFYGLATPFYSIYAVSRLNVGESIVGYFLSAQMFGRLAFSFIWGRLCNRSYYRQIFQYTGIIYLASLFLMLFLGLSSMSMEVMEYGILVAFMLTGAAMNGMWTGSNNYIMETTRAGRRPILLGFFNSLNVVTSILTLLGGSMLGYVAYEVVFLIAAVPLGLSLIVVRNFTMENSAR
jgi:MFS family permease